MTMRANFLGRYTAFGWVAVRMSLPAGAKLSYVIPQDVPRERLPAVNLWTKGHVTGVNLRSGNTVAPRVPGVLTSELVAPVLGGRFVMTAHEDSEFWCVSAKANGSRMPGLTKLQLGAGEVYTPTQLERVLVCAGELVVGGQPHTLGEAVEIAAGSVVSAPHGALALVFAGARQ